MIVESQKIVPAYMAHVVFQTKKFDEMIAWYTKVFHAKTLYANEKLCFMTFDDEHHRFAFFNLPPEAPEKHPMSPAVAHYAMTYKSPSDLLETYARLKSEGIEPRWAINHYVTTSLYYADPDGTEIELQVDNHATPEECIAVFSSDEYLQNPIGRPFNPDTLLQGLRAGKAHSVALVEAEATADPSALPMV